MNRTDAEKLQEAMRENQVRSRHNNKKPSQAATEMYDKFMGYYADWLKDGKEVNPIIIELYMLGTVPGPAITVMQGEVVTVFGLDGLKLPCSTKDLPEDVESALKQAKEMWNYLGGNHTPFNKGIVQNLLRGRFPNNSDPIRIGFLRFGYGERIVPFGVSLEPVLVGEAKLRVKSVYNPYDLETTKEVTFLDIANGEGPVIKAVKTWAMMERNFSSRYHPDGTPRS